MQADTALYAKVNCDVLVMGCGAAGGINLGPGATA